MTIPENAIDAAEQALSQFIEEPVDFSQIEGWTRQAAVQILEAVKPHQQAPLTTQQVKAQAKLIDLVEKQANIRWVDKQGSIRTGTLRRIDTPQDLVGAEVSITMHPGTQVDMQFSDLTTLITDGRLDELHPASQQGTHTQSHQRAHKTSQHTARARGMGM